MCDDNFGHVYPAGTDLAHFDQADPDDDHVAEAADDLKCAVAFMRKSEDLGEVMRVLRRAGKHLVELDSEVDYLNAVCSLDQENNAALLTLLIELAALPSAPLLNLIHNAARPHTREMTSPERLAVLEEMMREIALPRSAGLHQTRIADTLDLMAACAAGHVRVVSRLRAQDAKEERDDGTTG